MQILVFLIAIAAALLWWQNSPPPAESAADPIEAIETAAPAEVVDKAPIDPPEQDLSYSEPTLSPEDPAPLVPPARITPKPPIAGAVKPVSAFAATTAVLAVESSNTSAIDTSPPASNRTGIPPGFESLFEEQTSVIDVFYGGRFIGAFMATYTPDTIRFEDPVVIVQKIPNQLDPGKVTEALTGDLATNQEFLCYYTGQSNCGILETDIAGVIFSSEKFKADIFINPSLLSVSQSSSGKYLPASSSDLSFLQTLNYAFTGDEDEINQEDNLFMLSLLSYKENAIRMVSNYSDDVEDGSSELEINTLVGQRDWQGIRYIGGYFQTINEDLRFSSETNVVGLRIGTSLDTREDQRQSSGRSIQIFLQSRGEVSIFKDDRLVSTRIYDSGNQILDTSALPGGSYDIDIRIRDAGGERVETQFYVKNSGLPPEGEPLYFVELGRVSELLDSQTLPDPIDEYLLRGSINSRLNFNNAIIGGFSSTEDDAVLEAGWFGVGNYYDLLINGALARHDRYGFNTEARFNYHSAWLTGTYRRIWDDSTDSDLDQDQQDYGYINLIGEEQEQLTADLSFPVKLANVSLGARYIDRPESSSVTDYSASLDFEIFRTIDSNTRFRLEYNHSDNDDFIIASLSWRLSKDSFTFNVRPDYSWSDIDGEQDGDSRLSANADWDSRDMWDSQLRTGVSANASSAFNSYGANADWGGQYGRLRGQAEYVDNDDGENTTRLNGNAATSFVVNGQTAAFGGKEQNQSAVIIDLSSSSSDLDFDVLVNNSPRATAQSGRKTLVSLRPFEIYNIRLKARGSGFIYFEDIEHEVTLYPGNVISLSWEAERVDVIFGRIKDQYGKPVKNALIKGVAGIATTDDYGLFQAEVKSSMKQLQVETRKRSCKLDLPEYTTRQGIASIGNITCEMIEKPSAPAP